MACYHPLSACLISTSAGKVVSFDRGAAGQAISLPCGRCIGCRLEKARKWAVRLMHETEFHEDSSFITLTYSDEFLPPNYSIDARTCQLFLKRLRSAIAPTRIRFFLCGEYGDKSTRPHYHAIIFGFSFPDKVILKEDGEFRLYRSDFLDKTWGFGFCSIGEVSFDSAAYVANYATKKITGKPSLAFYGGLRPGGRCPEFLLMSRMPGIGTRWIERWHEDVFPSDEVIVRGHPARPPRFYDKYFESVDEPAFAEIRTKRSLAAEALTDLVKLSSGRVVEIHPSNNARRLAVRETVARAKLALKSRS